MSELRDFSRVEGLYHAALALGPSERDAFLKEACGADEVLLREVKSLLGYEEDARRLLEEPVAAAATQRLAVVRGTRLGPYQVTELIGAGGMGEVYRALDVRLGRDVAVKVLPEHVAKNPEALARLAREARTIASLNHPHICALHDIGREGQIDYLVMELVEGETLARRLVRGALPLDQVLRFGIEIAEALGAAHARGIVHRDLKPGNVMLTRSGTKLLDFGLAKLRPADEAAAAREEPTLTHENVLVGTPPYMAPEQIERGVADARTDIFALGLVLYEMLTGSRVFARSSRVETLNAILKENVPEMRTASGPAPATLDRLIRRCLEKDPDERFQAARDVAFALEELGSGSGSRVQGLLPSRAPRALVGPVAVALAIGALIGGVAVRRLGRSEPPVRPVVRFEIPVATASRYLRRPAISPDGTRLAYVAGGPEGLQLHLRALDSAGAMPLPGTGGAFEPFFSPDGQSIGFWASEHLMKVDLATGHVTKLCPAPQMTGATWGTDNRIYFSLFYGISVVSANGGQPEALTQVAPEEVAHGWPELLPGERSLMFSRQDTEALDDSKIEVLSLDGRERRTVLEGGYAAKYVPTGHLVYFHRGALMAVPFDVATLRLAGTPFKVMEGIAYWNFGGPLFDVSRSGMLAYFSGAEIGSRSDMAWIELPGRKRHAIDAPLGFYIDPVLSPDGRRLALAPNYGNRQDIWVADLTRGTWTRLTVNPRDDVAPVWRFDDPAAILFTMDRGPKQIGDLFSVPADGSRPPELVYESPYEKYASSSSAAAGLVAFTEIRPDTKADIWLLQLGARPAARPFLQTPFSESTPALSPDGAWLAYESDESGRQEIYARAISGTGGRWLISSGGGDHPRWSRDGRQIVYRSGKRMMATRVAMGASLTVDRPRVLFEGEFEEGGCCTPNYDIAPDGRFLMIEPSHDVGPATSRLVVIDNWFTELRQKLAR